MEITEKKIYSLLVDWKPSILVWAGDDKEWIKETYQDIKNKDEQIIRDIAYSYKQHLYLLNNGKFPSDDDDVDYIELSESMLKEYGDELLEEIEREFRNTYNEPIE